MNRQRANLHTSSTIDLKPSTVIIEAVGLKLLTVSSSTSLPKGLISPRSMDMAILSDVPGRVLLDMIRVANRVHKPPPTENGMSVRLRSKDDFPAD